VTRSPDGVDQRRLDEQLRALDDLRAEFEAGDLEPADYEALRDDYTLRVADLMRRLEEGGGPDRGPQPARRRRVGPVAIVVAAVFAAGAGWLLARSAGERGVGDALTGQIDSNRQRVFECQEIGVDGRLVESLQCFDEVLTRDPDNVEALTYRGWYVVLATSSAEATGQEEEAAELLEVGQTYLDRAVELDPTFPDARAFRAVLYDRLGRSADACTEVEALLELDPPPFVVDLTQGVVTRNGC
jgi:tetratricopeptide (TPR) repeat protein